MSVDIDSFKRDLDQLKNQRSIIQAKLDEANKHVAELTKTLNEMGFANIEEAKQAYSNQCAQAESQHALVQQLIQEINQVDSKIPTREEVMSRLNALSSIVPVPVNVESGTLPESPVSETSDIIQENIVPPVVPSNTNNSNSSSAQDVDLGGMLFASL